MVTDPRQVRTLAKKSLQAGEQGSRQWTTTGLVRFSVRSGTARDHALHEMRPRAPWKKNCPCLEHREGKQSTHVKSRARTSRAEAVKDHSIVAVRLKTLLSVTWFLFGKMCSCQHVAEHVWGISASWTVNIPAELLSHRAHRAIHATHTCIVSHALFSYPLVAGAVRLEGMVLQCKRPQMEEAC